MEFTDPWNGAFWRKVKIGARQECWPWQAGKISHGYGCFHGEHESIESKRYAHRIAYELTRGTIPAGLVIDHLCRTKECCNPWHMEPVTQRTNVLRGIGPSAIHAQKTHCPQGHSLHDAYRNANHPTHRRCRTCQIEQSRATRAKAKA